MEQVMDNMEVEIPDAMVEYEADNLVNDMAQRIQAQGIPFDQYLAMTGMTMDIMREQAKAAALERVRRELALAIVAAENITISDEELEEEYKRLAEQYHMDVDKVKAAVDAESIRKEQSYHKAEHVVYDSAKVGKAPPRRSPPRRRRRAPRARRSPRRPPARAPPARRWRRPPRRPWRRRRNKFPNDGHTLFVSLPVCGRMVGPAPDIKIKGDPSL